MFTLENSSLQVVSRLVYNAWNFKEEQISPDKIIKLKTDCQMFIKLPPQISFAIGEEISLRMGSLCIGLVIWMLEANSQTLKSYWFDRINLQKLCQLLTDEVKQNVLELSVDGLFPMICIESAVCFTNLKVLEILYDYDLSNYQVEQIISECINLEEIRLTGCRNVDGNAFNKLWQLKSIRENLRILDINRTSVSAARAVCLLEQLTKLQEFYYHNLTDFLRYQCRSKDFAKMVSKLQLGDPEEGDFFKLLSYDEFVSAAQDFKALREISLYIPYLCSCQVLKRICENWCNLNVLKLSFEPSLADIVDHSASHQLYLFQHVYSAIFTQHNFKFKEFQLMELELAWVQEIDLDLVFAAFPQLKALSMMHCTIVKNEQTLQSFVKHLCLSQMPSKMVNRILRNCIYLEELNISEIDLTVDTFNGVELKNFKKFSLECCSGNSLV